MNLAPMYDFVTQLWPAASAPVGEGVCEFKVSSLDGGRTWLHVTTQGQVQAEGPPNAHGLSARKDGRVLLTLVLPSAVSMLPLTSALRPVERYLSGGKSRNLLSEDMEAFATRDSKLEPIIQIFEAQPFRDGDDYDGKADLRAVIVISRAVPRPIEVCDCPHRWSNKVVDLSAKNCHTYPHLGW